jgi:hypothetical protein
MGQLVAPILGIAGTTYGMRKANKYSSQAFKQRMTDAEQYGIHPLQALCGAGTFMGTGGANLGSQISSELNSRKMDKEKRRAESRFDANREDSQAHELTLQEMRNAAEDARLTRTLEEKSRTPQWRQDYPSLNRSLWNWFFPPGEQDAVEFDSAMGKPYQSRDTRLEQRGQ